MTRRSISTRERVQIFEAASGVCSICGCKIAVGDAWDVSHEVPLALGGEDGGDNLRPAHRKCHRHHTATEDAPRIAKAKRVAAKHIGAVKSRNPLPFGRGSRLKKKLNGEIVERDE